MVSCPAPLNTALGLLDCALFELFSFSAASACIVVPLCYLNGSRQFYFPCFFFKERIEDGLQPDGLRIDGIGGKR